MSKRHRPEEGEVPDEEAVAVLPEASQKKPKLNSGSITLLDKIVAAIRALKSPNGSSAQAIQKTIATFSGSPTAFKNALKKGVEKGVLEKNKASFLVAGDAPYADNSAKVDIEDIIIGNEGDAVSVGTSCVISYTGALQLSGKRFDSSKSFSFTVGAGDVIKGMDKGVQGMRVGGKRRLIIPSSLGYGKRGNSPDIPADSTLCFEIKLLKIR